MPTTQNSKIDYNQIMKDFQNDSRDIFQNNVSEYTVNDRNFMQNLNQMFGNAMSAKGLNVLDPIYANFFHYNKMGMLGNVDFPRVTRTYCFFTRPELNFSIENLTAIPFFKWLYSKPIGKMIMCSLTDPEYFIGGPAALSNNNLSFSNMMSIVNEFVTEQKTLNRKFIDNTATNEFKTWYANSDINDDTSFTGLANYDGYDQTKLDAFRNDLNNSEEAKAAAEAAESDDPAEVARLQSVDMSALYDAATLDNLQSAFTKAQTAYQQFMAEYDGWVSSKNHTEALFSAYGIENKENYMKELAKMGIHQAKNMFIVDHDSPFDRFNFTSPFIPLLCNTCTQVTGGKDFNLSEHTYEEDEYSSTIKVPTGMDELWGPGTLNATFTDIAYGPVSLLFMVWVLYIHYVSRGNILTTREHIIERILDYTCSIYVFVIGEDGRRIERWGKFTGCYPTSFPMSSQLEHNTQIEKDVLQKLSITFSYNRYEPMDPQVFTDFNFLSESEWLVKLKHPLWENIYDRESSLKELTTVFEDLSTHKSQVELLKLHQLRRPNQLWDTVKDEERGMSGKLPMALIEPAPKTGGMSGHNPLFNQQTAEHRKNSEWYIDAMTNYWGGYPYINKGSELIWVLPQWSKSQDVYKDDQPIGSNSNYKQSQQPNNFGQFEESTGFSKHAILRESGTKAPNGFFIGNATLQNI